MVQSYPEIDKNCKFSKSPKNPKITVSNMAESKQKAKISIFILNHLMIKGLFLPMFPEEYEVRLVRLVPEAQIIDIRIVHDNFTFTHP